MKGEKRYEKESGDADARVVERHYRRLERSFTLPSAVDVARIDAKFDKGVSKATLPKNPDAATPGRRISIGKG
ncbi:MAG: Hsp20/alpha crystallin family protein [Parvibaculum sp.]|nr:Hsp20/alpha crystallin family protein [Parvibaculum sp.]MDO8838366.1 Hsp20/alpha crystallin family protein [Parvibaculum sp.]